MIEAMRAVCQSVLGKHGCVVSIASSRSTDWSSLMLRFLKTTGTPV
jgi:hypothetical protein